MNIAVGILGAEARLRHPVDQNICDHYLLTGVQECRGKNVQRYLKLTLENAGGSISGFVWPEFLAHITCPPVHSPVLVRGQTQIFNGNTQLRVESLTALHANETPSATALLSRQRCPTPAVPALDRLAELEASLPAPLDSFLRGVLLDPRILPGLLTCRASVSHHHAFPGGLLVHSTAMLTLAAELTRSIVPDDPWSPHLAQLGYLLHDFGKLRSVGASRRPQYPFAVPHEIMTIELLAPHLTWLEQRNLELATALRHLLSYLATPHSARKTPALAAAEVVVMLDQLSAATHNRRSIANLLAGPSALGMVPGRSCSSPSGPERLNPSVVAQNYPRRR